MFGPGRVVVRVRLACAAALVAGMLFFHRVSARTAVAEQSRCGACEKQKKHAESEPPARTGPPRIDPDASATYHWKSWRYSLRISTGKSVGTKRRGDLHHGGRALRAQRSNDWYDTPFGRVYWMGQAKETAGRRGWMPRPLNGVAMGRRLEAPGDKAMNKREFGSPDQGKTVQVQLGTTFTLRLGGNPTTGYEWITDAVEGDALRKDGRTYEAGGKGLDGEPGAYVFTFSARVKGRSVLRLSYRRPWRKKAPDASFVLTVEVVDGRDGPRNK